MTSPAQKGTRAGSKPIAKKSAAERTNAEGKPKTGRSSSRNVGASRPSAVPRDWLAEYAGKAGLDGAALQSLRDWLVEQFVADEFAKLGQGGHTENRIPLRRVFVDLPVSPNPIFHTERSHESAPFLAKLAITAAAPLSTLYPSVGVDEHIVGESGSAGNNQVRPGSHYGGGGHLLVGGPGQGKSTLGQLACQLHRAALLQGWPTELPSHDREVLHPFETAENKGLSPPEKPLFPLRVVLPDMASWFSNRKLAEPTENSGVPALLEFIADLPSARKAKLSASTLLSLVAVMPFFLLLDGFDEVGATYDRQRIVSEARSLLATLGEKGGQDVPE